MATKADKGKKFFSEMGQFATFPVATQEFIARTLHWSKHPDNCPAEMRVKFSAYARAKEVMPEHSGLDQIEPFIAPLRTASYLDLSQESWNGSPFSLHNFDAYYFLYERLLGAEARPWLVSGFTNAATDPRLKPERRKHLLQSIKESAAIAPGWSAQEALYHPPYTIERVDYPKIPPRPH